MTNFITKKDDPMPPLPEDGEIIDMNNTDNST